MDRVKQPPAISPPRRQLTVSVSPDEHQSFKMHSTDMNRRMSDIARTLLAPFFDYDEDVELPEVPESVAGPPPAISEPRLQLVVFLSPDEHKKFKRFAVKKRQHMSDIARAILAPHLS